MGARERLPVGLEDVRVGGEVRESRGDAVGARERLPVGCGDVLVGGAERAPRDTAVGARERLPVGPSDVRERDVHAQLRVVIMGSGERRTAIGEKKTLLKTLVYGTSFEDYRSSRRVEWKKRHPVISGFARSGVPKSWSARRAPSLHFMSNL